MINMLKKRLKRLSKKIVTIFEKLFLYFVLIQYMILV